MNASPPKKMAATMRVPRSRARFVETREPKVRILPHVGQSWRYLLVAPAKPHIIQAYARPIAQGADVGEMKGFAGSRTDQMITPCLVSIIRCPSHRMTYKEGADKELDENEIAIIGLRCTGKRTEDRARPTQRVRA